MLRCCTWYLLGPLTSVTTAFFCCLSINTMSGWLAFTSLSVSIWRSHRTLAHSFSITLGGVFHSDLGTSSPFSVQMLLYTTSATWLFLLPSYTLTLCVGLHTHTHIQCKVGCLFWKWMEEIFSCSYDWEISAPNSYWPEFWCYVFDPNYSFVILLNNSGTDDSDVVCFAVT